MFCVSKRFVLKKSQGSDDCIIELYQSNHGTSNFHVKWIIPGKKKKVDFLFLVIKPYGQDTNIEEIQHNTKDQYLKIHRIKPYVKNSSI